MQSTSSAESAPVSGRLNGRVAVVTGGAGNIGRGIVNRLRAEGAIVAIVDNDEELLEVATAEVGVLPVLADVRDDPRDPFDTVTERFGEPDILVCAAGVIPSVHWSETTIDVWDETIAVNLTAPFRWTFEACRRWADRRAGAIVHVASVESIIAFPLQVAYASSKAGLAGMIRGFAVDLGASGIRVCGVGPGTVPNERRNGPLRKPESYIKRIPLGRFGTPDDIGAAVAFLASDDASWVTGEILYVDGGYVSQ